MQIRALSPFLLAALGSFAPSALAQDCADDADCPAGYGCVEYVQSCPDCPPDIVCEPCGEDTTVSVCELVPAPCASDEDCEDGMICVHFIGESCPGAEPCRADDPDCSTSDPAPCESVDESWCAPPWVAPCVADADCGPGFTCESSEVCTCVVYPEPGTGEPPPPEECSCEPSGERYCALAYQACATDEECPEGLVCSEGGVTDAAPCYVDENGNEECPEVDAEPFCAPPGYLTPLPLEGGEVSAERADDGAPPADDDDEDGALRLCASRQVGGPAPWAALGLLVALPTLLVRRR